jgi:TetR/AcrR family transcriptional repressor of nem operon
MARPREFDRQAVLAAAMRCFQARGYKATSMRDLQVATGLKPGSLYNGFGDKDAIFQTVLDHYVEVVVAARIAHHLRGKSPVEELRALFGSILNEPDATTWGCLLTNTAVEAAVLNPAISKKVRGGFALLEDGFARQCALAKTMGLLAGRTDTRRTALQLLHAYQGLLVLVRFGRAPEDLMLLIDDVLDGLFKEDGK